MAPSVLPGPGTDGCSPRPVRDATIGPCAHVRNQSATPSNGRVSVDRARRRPPRLPRRADRGSPAGLRPIGPVRATAPAIERPTRAAATPAPGSAHPASRPSSPSGSTRVLGIAGRLAASHDRRAFRTVVDETKRALRADVDDDPDPPRRSPRGRRVGRSRRRGRRAAAGLPPRRGLGRGGAAHRPGPGLRRRPRRRRDAGSTATTASWSSPATSSRRSSTTTGSSARCRPSRPSRAPGRRRRRLHHDPRDARGDRPGQCRAASSRPRRAPPSSRSSRPRRPG